jgi:hypothetical protein
MAIELIEDEILEIIEIGYEDTIDIELDGNRLFIANGILTHNCGIGEVEFDQSHVSGGISKVQTSDNVFGIFTSTAMRERGQYQIQMIKTRNSSGVGSKVDLAFNVDTLRITDNDTQKTTTQSGSASSFLQQVKSRSNATQPQQQSETKKVNAKVESSKLRELLNTIPE